MNINHLQIPLMKHLVIGRGFSHKEALNEVLKQKGLLNTVAIQ